ncbi:1-acyl-sn-glycerol-3-phosphate acyltransferase [bacterium]|nr:1-acyl-sn-glycerol-3-phosphate acyltransferase [bacterium]
MKFKPSQLLEKEREFFPKEVFSHLQFFFFAYDKVLQEKQLDEVAIEKRLKHYLLMVKKELHMPTIFGTYREREKEPSDLYQFAVEALKPFVDKEESLVLGKDNIEKIVSYLQKGENVILLANHQAEADPALLGVLLEDCYPNLIREMIAVAGARVTTDPLAVPFTRGQNVICVYSKKYFEMHKDKLQQMLTHNSRAILTLCHQLNKGGKLIYVAPSGGRDRKDAHGKLAPAMFNPDSIETMRVVGSKAKAKTHYFPLALYTYPILPPPETIKKEIGEKRIFSHSPIHLYFGEEIEMRAPTKEERAEKVLFRKNQAEHVHALVTKLYDQIPKNKAL